MNRYVWEQNDRLRFLPARFLLKASLILFVAPLGWMQESIKTNNASVDTLRLGQQVCTCQMSVNSFFERELALLVALQGESIWKGGCCCCWGDINLRR